MQNVTLTPPTFVSVLNKDNKCRVCVVAAVTSARHDDDARAIWRWENHIVVRATDINVLRFVPVGGVEHRRWCKNTEAKQS